VNTALCVLRDGGCAALITDYDQFWNNLLFSSLFLSKALPDE
jgi:hypothetical protein